MPPIRLDAAMRLAAALALLVAARAAAQRPSQSQSATVAVSLRVLPQASFERATDEPTHNRFKRMEAAWRALAEEQDWLDGETVAGKKAEE